jgi:hypothetical protein
MATVFLNTQFKVLHSVRCAHSEAHYVIQDYQKLSRLISNTPARINVVTFIPHKPHLPQSISFSTLLTIQLRAAVLCCWAVV